MTPEAEAVRKAYRLRRHIHQPKWNGSNTRWQVCWEKTANLVREHGFDLDRYIEAQFELKAPFPMPNQLYNQEALNRYELYNKQRIDPTEEILRRLSVELNFLETRLDVGFSLDEILALPKAPLTPLFCYCVAVKFRRSDLAQIFEEPANQHLAHVPAAKSVYRSLLSEGKNADI